MLGGSLVAGTRVASGSCYCRVAATLPVMSAFACSMSISLTHVDMWVHPEVCLEASGKLVCHCRQLSGSSVEGAAAAAWHPERGSLSDVTKSGQGTNPVLTFLDIPSSASREAKRDRSPQEVSYHLG